MQPFTSADGRFSVLFPGTPQQSPIPINLKNGETATLYRFACADNGTVYVVAYINYPADYVNGYPADSAISDPQVRLQAVEKGDAAGNTLFRDQAIDLDGVPGRDYTFTGSFADGSSRIRNVHEYLAGNRLYTLTVLSPPIPLKGDTAAHADQFMNSFRILDNPPRP